MASNRSALDEAPYGTSGGAGPSGTAVFAPGAADDGEPWEEWNPTEESVAPVRGRHRVVKQRGGTMARSGAVLGVGVIAAVGAGGMATAKDRPNAPISMPDLAHVADEVQDALPDTKDLPVIGPLISDGDPSGTGTRGSGTPLSQAGLTPQDRASGTTDAGEALRARIMQQAEQQQTAADEAQREAAARAEAAAAAKAAAEQKAKDVAQQKAAKAEAERKAAEEAERKAAEAARKAEAERRAKLAASYALPLASYTLTSSFGEAGDMWSADHTGQDFAAPTGTPVKAVHGGTITEAGWAGSYGYRIVLTLEDGTEVWYCHLSSMVRTSGSVSTGDVIGRVGATGNVTGPHLHLEVRPGGGAPIDPLAWLREHGQNP
ncbi:M23 family metallopeptidase [Streptomyces sp. XD-27]|uniref:M23 family metallopeptidase n=1 Tax=Streptomyces sp. XD-27 TaxID=3062779 RepID=UPI0026F4464D|nr:M23 family metallopeptidase [Streptomyces sp. XD-27]WKX71200.1 M23 family metallopeptidase [Streptomyces sp. XD-27]